MVFYYPKTQGITYLTINKLSVLIWSMVLKHLLLRNKFLRKK